MLQILFLIDICGNGLIFNFIFHILVLKAIMSLTPLLIQTSFQSHCEHYTFAISNCLIPPKAIITATYERKTGDFCPLSDPVFLNQCGIYRLSINAAYIHFQPGFSLS